MFGLYELLLIVVVWIFAGLSQEHDRFDNGSSSGDCVGSAKAAPYADHFLMKTKAMPTCIGGSLLWSAADLECLRPSPALLRAIVIGISGAWFL